MSKRDPGFFVMSDCIEPVKNKKRPFPVVKMLLALIAIIYLLILVKWIL
jgi:competence protein ComGC